MARFSAEAYAEATTEMSDLGTVLTDILFTLLNERKSIVLHSLPWRVKSRESAERKMLASPEAYPTYDSLHDLLGIRVITLFESDIELAEVVIREILDLDPAKSGDRLAKYQLDQFGYRSRHFVGRLSPLRAKLPENRRFAKCTVEIQLRSILQHTWAEIEHDLGYKPQREVTPTLRRRFSQLAALMELADDNFSQLRTELEVVETAALEEPSNSHLEATLTAASLQAYVRNDPDIRAFEQQLARRLHTQVNPPGHKSREFIGHLLDMCTSVGWTTKEDVSSALSRYKQDVLSKLSRIDEQTKSLLEYPRGDGLRPGFSIILLSEVKRGD